MKRVINLWVGICLLSSIFFVPNFAEAKNDDMIGTVVSISVYDAYVEDGQNMYNEIQRGSGVLIDEYGTIATNAHVVNFENETDIKGNPFISVCIGRFIFVDNKCNYKASLMKKYENIDLAFLNVNGILFSNDRVDSIDPYEFKFLKHNYVKIPMGYPKFGDKVTIIGYPFYTDSYTASYDFGEIIKKPNVDTSEYGKDESYFFTDAYVTYGNSGGGAFNSDSEFIGMPTFVYNEFAGLLKYDQIFKHYEEDIIKNIDKTEGDTSKIVDIKNEIIGETPFTDVDIFSPYYGPLYALFDTGIIEGYKDGTFGVYNTINRAEFSKLAYELINDEVREEGLKNCFPDVKDEWFAESVCNLKNLNIVEGYEDGTFNPFSNIRFAEASKILGLIYGDSYINSDPWYKSYVEILESKKAIPYSIKSFDQELTRGEMAVMVNNLYFDNSLESEMKYSDIDKDREIRIDDFLAKIDKSVSLASKFENIGFRSWINNYFEGEKTYSCNRSFYMPEFNVYGAEAKSLARLYCENLQTGEVIYNYGLKRNGYQMQYTGENQPIFEPSAWKLGIDAKGYTLLENIEYYSEHIYDVETDGRIFKVKIDPLLGLATRYENYHSASIDGALDFYMFRLRNNPLSYDLEFEFDGIGHLLRFSMIETAGGHVFERDVEMDYASKHVNYEFAK